MQQAVCRSAQIVGLRRQEIFLALICSVAFSYALKSVYGQVLPKRARLNKPDQSVREYGSTYMRSDVSVAQAMDYWLRHRELEVRGSTIKMYRQFRLYIVGPLLVGSRMQRLNFSRRGIVPRDAAFLEMLGARKIHELKTAIIRDSH